MNKIREPEKWQQQPPLPSQLAQERRNRQLLTRYIANANRLRRKLLGLMDRARIKPPPD